jgi:hypothetical protein
VDLAALATFTPVALDLAPPAGAVDWGDLAGLRFAEPFFDQTVERWAGGSAARLVRTDLAALAALDYAPSLDPSALVFHLSRCGSTLVSRLLARIPGTLVIAEPRPVNTLLLADPGMLDEAAAARLLRLLVRALGRRRFGDERRYVLKLSSWNIARLGLFRRAFPGVPLIWVQRAPDEVMASVLADPPGWSELRRAPRLAEQLFAIPPGELADLDAASFHIRALAALLAAAHDAADELLIADYRELPEAVWTRIAPRIGVEPGEDDIARLRDEARYHSKDPARRLFTGDRPERRALPDAVRALAAERLEPLYRALEARRSARLERS